MRADIINSLKQQNKDGILSNIERLEYILQTRKEAEIIKKIDNYNKLLNKIKKIDELTIKIREKPNEISELLKKSSEEHQKVLENAKISTKIHAELLDIYYEINRLKAKSKELYQLISTKQ
ncbi:DUF7121 family protein [Methanotorris igneus]|nr:hypothetical protein [Methanotorris igneus]